MRILLAEFDRDTANWMIDVLRKAGHEVTQAYTTSDRTWSEAEEEAYDAVIIGDHFAQFTDFGFDTTLQEAVYAFSCPVIVFGDGCLKNAVEAVGARWMRLASTDSVLNALAA